MNQESKTKDFIGAASVAITAEMIVAIVVIVAAAIGVNAGALTAVISNYWGG